MQKIKKLVIKYKEITIILLVYINITIKRIFRDSKIIRYFISGLCNKESSGIIKKLDRSYLILFIHESYRLAYKLHGFFDETIQKIVDTVSDLLRLLFFVLRGDQIIKGTVDQGQLGDVVVDAEYIVKAAVIVLYI